MPAHGDTGMRPCRARALWVALRMTDDAAPTRKPRRRGVALALVLVASVLAFPAILAVWVNRQVLNTDNWTTASSRMLESPAVRNQLAAYLVDQLYANVDVEAQIRERCRHGRNRSPGRRPGCCATGSRCGPGRRWRAPRRRNAGRKPTAPRTGVAPGDRR